MVMGTGSTFRERGGGKSFTVRGNLSDILEQLRTRAGFKRTITFSDAISWLIAKMKEKGYAKIYSSPIGTAYGFYWDEEGRRICFIGVEDPFVRSKLLIYRNFTEEDLRRGLESFFNIIYYYAKTPQQLQKIFTIVYWYTLAPFSFVRRQKTLTFPFLLVTGPSGTAKSFSNYLGLAIWGCYKNPDTIRSGSTMARPPRLAYALEETTFPIFADEGGLFIAALRSCGDTRKEGSEIAEMLKLLCESTYDARSHAKRRFIPARSIAVAANYGMSSYIPSSLRIRCLNIETDSAEKHTLEERRKVMEMLEQGYRDLAFIGSWIYRKVVQEQDEGLIDCIFAPDPLLGAKRIWEMLLEELGIDFTLPDPIPVGQFERARSLASLLFSAVRQELLSLGQKLGIKEGGRELVSKLNEAGALPEGVYFMPRIDALFITSESLSLIEKIHGFEPELGSIGDLASEGYSVGKRKVKVGNEWKGKHGAVVPISSVFPEKEVGEEGERSDEESFTTFTTLLSPAPYFSSEEDGNSGSKSSKSSNIFSGSNGSKSSKTSPPSILTSRKNPEPAEPSEPSPGKEILSTLLDKARSLRAEGKSDGEIRSELEIFVQQTFPSRASAVLEGGILDYVIETARGDAHGDGEAHN